MSEPSAPSSTVKRSFLFSPSYLVATGFGAGYSPIAPGTAGSLLGLLLYMIPGFEHPLFLALLTLVTFFVGTAAATRIEKMHGKDPSIVVIDEVVGMWISLLFIPKGIIAALAAFFLFRFFDIIKPPPARQAERLPGGWGIMLDDVFAALYANLALQLLLYAAPGIFHIL